LLSKSKIFFFNYINITFNLGRTSWPGELDRKRYPYFVVS